MDQNHSPERAGTLTRRGLVGGAIAAAAGAALTTRAEAQAPAPPPGLPNLYPNWTGNEFNAILKHENAHLPAVINAIKALGGTPRPKPNFKNLAQPNVLAFGTVSHVFERVGTGANFGSGPAIFSKQVLAFAASIGFIEAQHAGWLNSLFNLSQTTDVFGNDQDFQGPLTPAQVVDLTSPFIVDLNGGPPPTYSMTPSRNNDIAVLNFVLLIEFLENDFYNINVPRFFPVG